MRFADVVASMVQAGDMVWVQDYHLMLLPMLLRSVISGENSQGEMVRRELGRVKKGVDKEVVGGMMGMKEEGVALGLNVEGETEDEGVEMLDEVKEEGESLTPTLAQGDAGELEATPKKETTQAPTKKKRPGFGRGMSQFQKQEAVAKEKGKEGVRIGFFLHTPFPSSEIYRLVPLLLFLLSILIPCFKGCADRTVFYQSGEKSFWVSFNVILLGMSLFSCLPYII